MSEANFKFVHTHLVMNNCTINDKRLKKRNVINMKAKKESIGQRQPNKN